ncbi:uncharacterized protein SCODWIG_03196 [Saccharomycodes ludwigii]|uniref:Uncharacterized protein n=1 Tax=Saccharomycodes ludwigii TaxID=36035 RepID=A0A376B9S2_9ASCO|nr:hypothetical protein SCDLUD_005312 [Saccharomycodes ludwigii]KAH3898965.1 hypothetical protein SCDLUD_005312 [Saccharomycodes ludwigii]SSD61435.1 uncharacterized protein SCODWIG_03196 [Saccharomycodes ludwigii]
MSSSSRGRSILLNTSSGTNTNVNTATNVTPNIQIVESDRSLSPTNNINNTTPLDTSISRVCSESRSRSISRSRSLSSIFNQQSLKWTIIRRNPAERLNTEDIAASNTNNIGSSSSDLLDDESDEEQVSDVENEADIDAKLTYEMGSQVLPNFEMNLNRIVENSKPWVEAYKAEHKNVAELIDTQELQGGCNRASVVIGGNALDSPENTSGKSYIVFHDLTQECQYALTYTFGAVLNKNDTVYILHTESSGSGSKLQENVLKIFYHVKFLFDNFHTLEEKDIQVAIVSVAHPYPKHLLNTMVYSLSPTLIIVSLSVILGTLSNYISTVPMLVVRRKLKKVKKLGLYD